MVMSTLSNDHATEKINNQNSREYNSGEKMSHQTTLIAKLIATPSHCRKSSERNLAARCAMATGE